MAHHESPTLGLPVGERDHVLGAGDARVTLVEYGDYECPHCGQANAVVKELISRLGDQVNYVFRHFPLKSVHTQAQLAAEAAEAAAAKCHAAKVLFLP